MKKTLNLEDYYNALESELKILISKLEALKIQLESISTKDEEKPNNKSS